MSDTLDTEKILDLSPSAEEKIGELIASRDRKDLAVRVAIRGTLPGGGYQTEFKFIGRDEVNGEDILQSYSTFDIVVDPEIAAKIQGAIVDFDKDRYSAGFNIEYPHTHNAQSPVESGKKWDDPVSQKVQTVVDEYINPGVAAHGGWVALLEVKDSQAHVEMGGGCQGCGLAAVTLRQGVEQAILQAVPEISAVVDVTEHEQGADPYYSQESAEAMKNASPFDK